MAKEIQKTENKADVVPYVIAAEVGAPLIGANATPDGEHPYIDDRTIIVEQGVITEVIGEQVPVSEKDDEIKALQIQLTEKDDEIKRLSTIATNATRHAPTANAREFLVVEGYCGVDKGDRVVSDKIDTIRHMVKGGFWKEV